MYLQRYVKPKKTFALYIPKKKSSVNASNKVHSSLPPLVIPSNNLNKKDQIHNIPPKFSFNITTNSNYKPIVDNEVSKFISLSANRHIINDEIVIGSINPLPSPKSPEFSKILEEKIKICNYIMNFDKSEIQANSKNEKASALTEIKSLLYNKSGISYITNPQKSLIYDMIMNNIFDQDPYIAYESIYSPTIKWSFIEPSWPHLNLVYQILNQYITIFPERCKLDLIYKAIRLLNIPDEFEGESIISFIKCYLSIHPKQLNEVWRMLQNALINVISNIYTPYCINPIITFISSSISPDSILKIFKTHLLPLYLQEQLFLYKNSLTDLVIKIIDKNIFDQIETLEYLISHFPYQCGQKQHIFISVIDSILSIIFDIELNSIAPKLISFLGSVLKSSNAKLVEISIKILLKPTMTSILFRNSNLAMDNFHEPLNFISCHFWDNSIRPIAKKALTTLTNISYEVKKNGPVQPNSVNSSRLSVISNEEECKQIQNDDRKSDNSELIAKWALVARSASRRDESIDLTSSLLHIQEKLLNEHKISRL